MPVLHGRALVRSLGGQPGMDLHIINGLSARLPARAAVRLAASPLVHAVSLNAAIRDTTLTDPTPWTLATSFDQSTGASKLWCHSTGAGIGVAVIDTGISGDLPDFQTAQGSSTSRVIASAVIDPNATTASDTYGHGTAVAGLVAGNGWYRDSERLAYGQYAGTAPDANLISIKVADDAGQATTLDAIYGLQFAVDHEVRLQHPGRQPVVPVDLGGVLHDRSARRRRRAGLVPRDHRRRRGRQPGERARRGVVRPGNDPYIITVGAGDDQGTVSNWDDVQASWSSRGVTQDGFSKPDVLAPGAHIVTTLAPGSSFASACSDLRGRGRILPAQRDVAGRPGRVGYRRRPARGASLVDARDGKGRDRQHRRSAFRRG